MPARRVAGRGAKKEKFQGRTESDDEPVMSRGGAERPTNGAATNQQQQATTTGTFALQPQTPGSGGTGAACSARARRPRGRGGARVCACLPERWLACKQQWATRAQRTVSTTAWDHLHSVHAVTCVCTPVWPETTTTPCIERAGRLNDEMSVSATPPSPSPPSSSAPPLHSTSSTAAAAHTHTPPTVSTHPQRVGAARPRARPLRRLSPSRGA